MIGLGEDVVARADAELVAVVLTREGLKGVSRLLLQCIMKRQSDPW